MIQKNFKIRKMMTHHNKNEAFFSVQRKNIVTFPKDTTVKSKHWHRHADQNLAVPSPFSMSVTMHGHVGLPRKSEACPVVLAMDAQVTHHHHCDWVPSQEYPHELTPKSELYSA
jgi:hypothetical protein